MSVSRKIALIMSADIVHTAPELVQWGGIWGVNSGSFFVDSELPVCGGEESLRTTTVPSLCEAFLLLLVHIAAFGGRRLWLLESD